MNRIKKFDTTIKAKCLVVSNLEENWVSMSFNGERLVWKFSGDKLVTPGNDDGVVVTPLAASCVVKEDIYHILSMDGIEDVVFVDNNGIRTDGPILYNGKIDNEVRVRINALASIYTRYTACGFRISKSMIEESQKYLVIDDFLSLINM
jgi:hypothetical protein